MTDTQLRLDTETATMLIDALGRRLNAVIICHDERTARHRLDDLSADLPAVLIVKCVKSNGLLQLTLAGTGSTVSIISQHHRDWARGRSLDYALLDADAHLTDEASRDVTLALLTRQGRRILTTAR